MRPSFKFYMPQQRNSECVITGTDTPFVAELRSIETHHAGIVLVPPEAPLAQLRPRKINFLVRFLAHTRSQSEGGHGLSLCRECGRPVFGHMVKLKAQRMRSDTHTSARHTSVANI